MRRPTTSKIVLFFITITYFIVFAIGLAWVLGAYQRNELDLSLQALIALFSFTGGATAITIPFYLWKAKNENINKYGETPFGRDRW